MCTTERMLQIERLITQQTYDWTSYETFIGQLIEGIRERDEKIEKLKTQLREIKILANEETHEES